jgi:hypothetical protein
MIVLIGPLGDRTLQPFFKISRTNAFQSALTAGVIFIAYKNSKLDSDHHVNSMKEVSDALKSRAR